MIKNVFKMLTFIKDEDEAKEKEDEEVSLCLNVPSFLILFRIYYMTEIVSVVNLRPWLRYSTGT